MAGKEELSSPLDLIHRVSQRADRLFARSGGAAGPSSREHAVLRAVSKADGLNQTAIMAATGLDRSSTADLVRRLVSRGFLRRRRTRRDVRQYAIRLTQRGLDHFRLGEVAAKAAEAELLSKLSRTDRAALIAMLRAIADGGSG